MKVVLESLSYERGDASITENFVHSNVVYNIRMNIR